MGEYIAQQMYPGVDRNDLSEELRQTISALGTLAAGLAGGVTGDSTAGAQAGKNAVENNNLSFDEARAFDKELSACKKSGGDYSNIINRYDSINKSNREKMHALVASDPLTALAGQTKWDIDGGLAAASRPDWLYGSLDNHRVKDYVLANNTTDLTYLNQHVTNSDRAKAFFGEPKNYWGFVGGIKSLFSSAATNNEKLIGSSLSFGANGAVQITSGNTGDKVDYVGFLASGPTGAATAGKSYYASQLIGAGSAYMTSQITAQDSKVAVLGSMAGTALGYGVGGVITKKFESQYIKNQLGMDASKNALKYSETSFGPGCLLNGGEMSPLPGTIGTIGGFGGSLISEGASSATQKEKSEGGK